MDDYYDYSQHSYCITFGFDENSGYSDCFFSNYKEENSSHSKHTFKTSILYNTTTEEFWITDDDINRRESNDLFYVNNVFTKLYEIYENKKSNPNYETDLHDDFIVSALVKILQRQVEIYQDVKITNGVNKSDSLPHFVFFLPTRWDHEIREDMIRSIFVQAKLITENDHKGRLLFFTELDSTFRYLQSLYNDKNKKMNIDIKNGKQFILYGLKFEDTKLSVNLDLFSAHYPAIKAIDTNYVTNSLESIFFTVPLISVTLKNGIEKCLIDRNFDINTSKIRKLLTLLIKQYKKQEFISKGESYESSDIHKYEPFKYLRINPKECELSEDETKLIKLITMEEIHEELLKLLDSTFLEYIESLIGTRGDKIRVGIVTLLKTNRIFTKRFDHNFNGFISWMVVNWLKTKLKTYGEDNFNYSLATFGESSEPSIEIFWPITMKGNRIYIKDTIQKSNKYIPPSIIPGKRIYPFNVPSTFDQLKLNYIKNIVISSNSIQYVCSYIDSNNRVAKTMQYKECNIKPLCDFFNQFIPYQHPTLLLSNRMKIFMDENFKKMVNMYSKQPQKKLEKESIKNTGLKIKRLINLGVMDDFFSKSKHVIKSKDVILIHQTEYIRLFLLMYLGYLDRLIINQLNQNFENNWTKKNVGNVISVEKILLDNLSISKEEFQKLIFSSDIFQEQDTCNSRVKNVIIIQGQGVLPIIQQHSGLNLALKSYFVLAQLHKNYLQITLNQVVKVLSPKENASSIIIGDEIISIENINDTLYKNIWKHIQSNEQIDYCNEHGKQSKENANLNELKKYKSVLEALKQHLSEILSYNAMSSFSMDAKTRINLVNSCSCSIHLSLRNIIEIGMKPILQNITTIIADSVSNSNIYGKYQVDFLFILGNIFSLMSSSPIYKLYTLMLQDAFKESITVKEKDTCGYFLAENLCQLLQPVINKQPYMLDSFTVGNLYQVSRETYGIYVNSFTIEDRLSYDPQLCDVQYNTKENGIDGQVLTVILQKGQHIPNEGLIKLSNEVFKKSEQYKKGDILNLVIDLVRVEYLDNSITLSETVSLDDYSHNTVASLAVRCDQRIFVSPVRLDIKSINYNSSIQFSLRMIGDGDEFQDEDRCVLVREQLSVAYF